MTEKINSAIRAYLKPGKTVVATDSGRWLLVEGYREEREEAMLRKDTSPLVRNVTVVREATKREFYASCNSCDVPAFRHELTDAGEQAVIPGCERDSEQGGAKQMDLF